MEALGLVAQVCQPLIESAASALCEVRFNSAAWLNILILIGILVCTGGGEASGGAVSGTDIVAIALFCCIVCEVCVSLYICAVNLCVGPCLSVFESV